MGKDEDDVTVDSGGPRAAFRPAGRVGRYVILEKLGEGGMGVVYTAYDDELDRRVALKLINPHGSPAAAQNRLVREARAMAKLQHPNVVAVHDAQTVGESVYVAMEYVPGADLRRWRSRRKRTLQEIVDVFLQAGRGLAAAHAAGIVHRDFKPGNVLVGDDGRTRVADFGLAVGKALPFPEEEPAEEGAEPDDPTSSRVTRSGELVGTPAYMSPEQHRGDPATPLSDQFSFCVSLYEAVCDRRPFTPDQLKRGAATPDAPGAPAWLRAILIRGLSSLPEKRFPTMDALLRELARDPAARRRRWALSAAAAIVLGGAAWGVFALRPAEPCTGATARLAGVWDDAQKARLGQAFRATGVAYADATLRAAAAVLDRYAADLSGGYTEACRAARVRREQSEETMARRMACLDQRRQSLAATTNVLAAADREVVDNAVTAARALPELGSCADVDLLSQLPPPQDRAAQARVAAVREQLADARALFHSGKYARSLEIAEAAAAAAKPLAFLPLTAEVDLQRGEVLDEVGRHADAADAFYESIYAAEAARHERVLAEAWVYQIWMMGVRLRRLDELPRVVRMADAALRRDGDPPDLRARYWSYRGSAAAHEGTPAEADDYYRRALAILDETAGPNDPRAIDIRFNLGIAAQKRGRYADALEAFRPALAAYTAAYGPEHPHTARAQYTVGNALVLLDRHAEAVEVLAAAAAVRERLLGPEHSDLANTLNTWGLALAGLGRRDEALEKYRRALAIKEKNLGPDHPSVANTLANLGACLVEAGDIDGARPWLERALAIREKKWPQGHPDVVNALKRLATLEIAAGHHSEALRHATRGAELADKVLPDDHPERMAIVRKVTEAKQLLAKSR